MKSKKETRKVAAQTPAPNPNPNPNPAAVSIPLAWRSTILSCAEVDTHRALLLLMYCKATGSRTIKDARDWNPAHWLTRVGIREVPLSNTPYWKWNNRDLIVLFGKQEQKGDAK